MWSKVAATWVEKGYCHVAPIIFSLPMDIGTKRKASALDAPTKKETKKNIWEGEAQLTASKVHGYPGLIVAPALTPTRYDAVPDVVTHTGCVDKKCTTCVVYQGSIPADLQISAEAFEALWAFKPEEKASFPHRGRMITLTRSQQAFRSPPLVLQPLAAWTERITGYPITATLLAFYEGQDHLKAHSDIPSCPGMLGHSPIPSFSFYPSNDPLLFRPFRFHPPTHHKSSKKLSEIPMKNNSVLFMTGTCQEHMRHSVPKPAKKLVGQDLRRLNVTFRTFAKIE